MVEHPTPAAARRAMGLLLHAARIDPVLMDAARKVDRFLHDAAAALADHEDCVPANDYAAGLVNLAARLDAEVAALRAERDDLHASREMWATARSEEISLDLAALRARLDGAVRLLDVYGHADDSRDCPTCVFLSAAALNKGEKDDG